METAKPQEIKEQLAAGEKQELQQLETTIRAGHKASFSVGEALKTINDKGLYRGHGTFEEYCLGKWSMTDKYAYKLIAAFEVTQVLTPMGDPLPINESQVRPLTRLKKNQWVAAWKAIVKLAGGEPITAELVESYVQSKLDPAAKGRTKKQKKVKAGKIPARIKVMIGWINKARQKVKAGKIAGLAAILDRIKQRLKQLKLA